MKSLILKSLKEWNLIAIIIIAIACNIIKQDIDPDVWSRLYCGSSYLKHGWVYYNDLFAFTETNNIWVDHEWLSGIIFFLLYKYFGSIGLLFLKCGITILTMILIYLTMRLRSDSDKNILFLILILFGIGSAFLSIIRPHIFTYMFFSMWLLFLEYARINKTYKHLWILPLTIPIWVNLHAGCIAGIALVCVYTFNQIINKQIYKQYLLIIVASVILIMVNPYTYHYFTYIIYELTSDHLTISEWESVNILDFKTFIYFKILVFLSLIGIIYSVIKKQSLDPVTVILFLTLGYMGFSSGRHTVLFVIVSGVFSYELISFMLKTSGENFIKKLSEKHRDHLRFAFNKGFPLLFIILFTPGILTFNYKKWGLENINNLKNYPLSSIEFLKLNSIKGNILLPYYWGGYTTWKLYPDNLVSVDGRHVEIYPKKVFNTFNYFFFYRSKPTKIFEKYPIQILLLDKRFTDNYINKIDQNKWKQVFEDSNSTIWLPSNYKGIKKFKTPKKSSIKPGKSYFMN